MFPVVHPKTVMRDAAFNFNFINIKTAMRNLFINRTRSYTHTNNEIGTGHIHFHFYKSEIDLHIWFNSLCQYQRYPNEGSWFKCDTDFLLKK